MTVPLFPQFGTQASSGAGQQSRHRSRRDSQMLSDLALGKPRYAHLKQLPRPVVQCIQRRPHGANALAPFHLLVGQRSWLDPLQSPKPETSSRSFSPQTVAKRVSRRPEKPAPEFLARSPDVLHNHTRERFLGRVRSEVRIARHGAATPQKRGIDLFEKFSRVHPLAPGRWARVRGHSLGSRRVPP